jgi:hypothetical protein
MLLMSIADANAVPSFARQTGQDCGTCHVGAFGPQLTPYGIKFKLGGYTETDGKGVKAPLSAMLVASNTRTKKDQDEPPAKHTTVNNNSTLDEVSVFLAGRISEHLGTFVQTTYDGIARHTSIDQTDIRGVYGTELFGKEAVLGLSLNNNPTVQDPFNTTPVWSFPYTASPVAFGAGGAGTLINGGLELRVVGLSAYGFWNDTVYGELGTYRSLPRSIQRDLGLGTDEDPGKLGSGTVYWRLALLQDRKKQAFSVGAFGLSTDIQPDRSGGPKNKFQDTGIDASYQFLGTREHIGTVYGSYIHERQTRDALIEGGEAENQSGSLDEFKVSASYYFRQTWGVTASRFITRGSADAVLYGDGFANGSPNTSGYVLQVDWTPFGKEDSWLSPWANLRLGAQYTLYDKFNGARNNYDGTGRDAKDNNTLFLFAWLSF